LKAIIHMVTIIILGRLATKGEISDWMGAFEADGGAYNADGSVDLEAFCPFYL